MNDKELIITILIMALSVGTVLYMVLIRLI